MKRDIHDEVLHGTMYYELNDFYKDLLSVQYEYEDTDELESIFGYFEGKIDKYKHIELIAGDDTYDISVLGTIYQGNESIKEFRDKIVLLHQKY